MKRIQMISCDKEAFRGVFVKIVLFTFWCLTFRRFRQEVVGPLNNQLEQKLPLVLGSAKLNKGPWGIALTIPQLWSFM